MLVKVDNLAKGTVMSFKGGVFFFSLMILFILLVILLKNGEKGQATKRLFIDED